MLFYKVTKIMEANEATEEDRRVRRENQRKIEMKSEEFNRNHSSNSFYFISEIDNTVVTAGVIADNKNKVESDLAEFFKVFGDVTRLKLLSVLFHSEMCVCDLAKTLNMTQSAISHQLRILKQMKLVKNRREGKTVFYSLADGHIKTIINQGTEHIQE